MLFCKRQNVHKTNIELTYTGKVLCYPSADPVHEEKLPSQVKLLDFVYHADSCQYFVMKIKENCMCTSAFQNQHNSKNQLDTIRKMPQ